MFHTKFTMWSEPKPRAAVTIISNVSGENGIAKGKAQVQWF